MSRRIRIVVLAAVFVLFGGIAGNSATAGSTRIDWRATGTIVNLMVPNFTGAGPTTLAAFLIQAEVNGAPGSARFTVVGIPDGFHPSLPQCGGGPGQTFTRNDMVIIFAAQSMLFARSAPPDGWICFQADGTVAAVANMVVDGGTGRYEGATGAFVGTFMGQPIGVSGALSVETGTIEGWIDR